LPIVGQAERIRADKIGINKIGNEIGANFIGIRKIGGGRAGAERPGRAGTEKPPEAPGLRGFIAYYIRGKGEVSSGPGPSYLPLYKGLLIFAHAAPARAQSRLTFVRQSSIVYAERFCMEFVSVRELCKSPKAAFDKIATDGKAVITNNGQPQAILVKVDAASFENTLSILQKLEFMQNLAEMRLASRCNGNSDLTLDEINAEIAATRADRKNQER
jgi:hypothetical protein